MMEIERKRILLNAFHDVENCCGAWPSDIAIALAPYELTPDEYMALVRLLEQDDMYIHANRVHAYATMGVTTP